MSGSLHVPQRPAWTCRACQDPWPCEPARRRLLAEYADAPVSLSLYLASCYVEASADLLGGGQLVGELYGQMIGWIRNR